MPLLAKLAGTVALGAFGAGGYVAVKSQTDEGFSRAVRLWTAAGPVVRFKLPFFDFMLFIENASGRSIPGGTAQAQSDSSNPGTGQEGMAGA